MRSRGDYKKLSSFSIGPFRRRSLWAASDHVLAAEASPFAESYRRYFYTDIQALVLTEINTPLRRSYYAFAALPMLAAAIVWRFTGNWAGSLFLIACSVVLPAILALRQECSCTIQTRLGAERLPSLRRLHSARKAVAIMQASIDRAQGALPPEFPPSIFDASATPDQVPPRLHYGLRLHTVFFAFVTLNALAHWFWVDRSAAWNIASNIISFILLGLAIMTAVRQHKTAVPKPIQTLIYLYLAQYALSVMITIVAVGVITGIAVARRNPNVEAALQGSPAILLVSTVAMLSERIIGVAGLFLTWRYRAQAPPSMFARGDRPQLG
jgi:hypothetical protein